MKRVLIFLIICSFSNYIFCQNNEKEKKKNEKELNAFLGKKYLQKSIRQRSEKDLILFISNWKNRELNFDEQYDKLPLNKYQKEVPQLIENSFNLVSNEDVRQKYLIQNIVLTELGSFDFSLPTIQQLDSLHIKDTFYLENTNKYNDYLPNYIRKDYISNVIKGSIQPYPINNKLSFILHNDSIEPLILSSERLQLINKTIEDENLRSTKWYIFRNKKKDKEYLLNHLIQKSTLESIIFNTTLDLALVSWHSPNSSDKTYLYQKVNDEWKYKCTIEYIYMCGQTYRYIPKWRRLLNKLNFMQRLKKNK